ncbi:MAG TPA: hypothetical protein PKD24_16530 [Pyrinomonadaceae bacterium]|nr:hypothetical protein [Pyrinomonadaceae bacterium]HMP67009.1 hypothetical protein [Pyrinomonadaceae bacterium]
MRVLIITVLGFVLTVNSLLSSNRTEKLEEFDMTKKEYLSLTGEITEMKVSELSDEVVIDFIARLRLKNMGKRPILFFREYLAFTGSELAGSPDGFGAKRIASSYQGYDLMACSQTLKDWVNARNRLDQVIPSDEEILVLSPGEEKTFDAVIPPLRIPIHPERSEVKADRARKSWEMIRSSPKIWVRIIADSYPSAGLEPDCHGSSFGNELRKRWDQHGYLWLDQILSEPIPFKLGSVSENEGQS